MQAMTDVRAHSGPERRDFVHSPRFYSADTGCRDYDSAQFSAPPQAIGWSLPGTDAWLVRHFGSIGQRNPVVLQSRNIENHCLTLNLSGGIRYVGTVGEKQFSGDVHHGRLNLFAAGVDLRFEFASSYCAISFLIPQADLDPILRETGVVMDSALVGVALPGVASLLLALEQAAKSPGQGSRLLYDATLMALAAELSGLKADQQERISITPAKLRRVTDFVMANLDRDIGLADMAAVASLSPFHFARVFRLGTGISPYRFLLQRRMALACELLADPTIPIVEIAHRCGYSGQAHFTTAFQQRIGMPPGRYRRQVAG